MSSDGRSTPPTPRLDAASGDDDGWTGELYHPGTPISAQVSRERGSESRSRGRASPQRVSPQPPHDPVNPIVQRLPSPTSHARRGALQVVLPALNHSPGEASRPFTPLAAQLDQSPLPAVVDDTTPARQRQLTAPRRARGRSLTPTPRLATSPSSSSDPKGKGKAPIAGRGRSRARSASPMASRASMGAGDSDRTPPAIDRSTDSISNARAVNPAGLTPTSDSPLVLHTMHLQPTMFTSFQPKKHRRKRSKTIMAVDFAPGEKVVRIGQAPAEPGSKPRRSRGKRRDTMTKYLVHGNDRDVEAPPPFGETEAHSALARAVAAHDSTMRQGLEEARENLPGEVNLDGLDDQFNQPHYFVSPGNERGDQLPRRSPSASPFTPTGRHDGAASSSTTTTSASPLTKSTPGKIKVHSNNYESPNKLVMRLPTAFNAGGPDQIDDRPLFYIYSFLRSQHQFFHACAKMAWQISTRGLIYGLLSVILILLLHWIPMQRVIEGTCDRFYYNPWSVTAFSIITLSLGVSVVPIVSTICVFTFERTGRLLYYWLIPSIVCIVVLLCVLQWSGAAAARYEIDTMLLLSAIPVAYLFAGVMIAKVTNDSKPRRVMTTLGIAIAVSYLCYRVLYQSYIMLPSAFTRGLWIVVVHPGYWQIVGAVLRALVTHRFLGIPPHLLSSLLHIVEAISVFQARMIINALPNFASIVLVSLLYTIVQTLCHLSIRKIDFAIYRLSRAISRGGSTTEPLEYFQEFPLWSFHADVLITTAMFELAAIVGTTPVVCLFRNHDHVFAGLYIHGGAGSECGLAPAIVIIQLLISLCSLVVIVFCMTAHRRLPMLEAWDERSETLPITLAVSIFAACALVLYSLRSVPSVWWCSDAEDPCTCGWMASMFQGQVT